jgi:hypothetical protein
MQNLGQVSLPVRASQASPEAQLALMARPAPTIESLHPNALLRIYLFVRTII